MESHILGQQLVNGLALGSIYGLIAVGYTMVYGIIGMINFAHGDIYMVAAYITAICIAVLSFFGINTVAIVLLITLAVTIFIIALYGWSIERVAYKPLRNSTRLAPLISAIGVSLILQNYVQVSQGARTQAVPTMIQGAFRFGSETDFFQITYIQTLLVVVSFLSMGILTWIIQKTSLGRQCRAVQQDRKMASLLGIDVDRTISLTFVIGAALAAVAGVMYLVQYNVVNFADGFVPGVKAFTAAVLGGIGSLPGAVLGGILIGLIETIWSAYFSIDYKDVAAFSILAIVLIFMPSGLLGRPDVEKV